MHFVHSWRHCSNFPLRRPRTNGRRIVDDCESPAMFSFVRILQTLHLPAACCCSVDANVGRSQLMRRRALYCKRKSFLCGIAFGGRCNAGTRSISALTLNEWFSRRFVIRFSTNIFPVSICRCLSHQICEQTFSVAVQLRFRYCFSVRMCSKMPANKTLRSIFCAKIGNCFLRKVCNRNKNLRRHRWRVVFIRIFIFLEIAWETRMHIRCKCDRRLAAGANQIFNCCHYKMQTPILLRPSLLVVAGL